MTLASPTFGSLIDAVLGNLQGWFTRQEQATTLTQAITNTDLTFSVDDASQISEGPIEIDSELMWVASADRQHNTVTIAPWGRGYMATTAVSHNLNAMVVSHPRFPRGQVSNALQETLYAVYPDLFVIKNDESQTAVPVQISYQVPADCDLIIGVRWKNIGPSQLWVPVRRWSFDAKADTTMFTTGKSVEIYDGMVPGQTIKITYASQPTQMTAETDALSVTGLADSVQDVLVFGACYRLVPALEAARLQSGSVEQTVRDLIVQRGDANGSAQFYEALYMQALQREALRLQKFYATKSHLVR